MVVKGEIKSGVYFDSVTLMMVGRNIAATKSVVDAAVVMGTRENKSILKSSGLWLDSFDVADDTDLLLAVKAENEKAAAGALRAADQQLKQVRDHAETGEKWRPQSLEGALKVLPGANVALISIAGRYAGQQAMKALKAGLHVMLFSDNVPLGEEIKLKKFARARGLLLMGPDCGTAIINGVPLAFANVVSRGNIGIVAAAGTGLQEVSTILSNEGVGISQAIGTGGRDVKKEVGGLMFLEGLNALSRDTNTHVIVLISKPPHVSVLRKIGKALKSVRKPVIAAFLGAEEKSVRNYGMIPAANLEEAALVAVALSKGQNAELARKTLRVRDRALIENAKREARQAAKSQKYIRGLFSGGTFCTEAQLVFREMAIRDVHSNVPLSPFATLADAWKSRGHTFVDLGEDAFTVGRPHPMIDYSLRNRRILEEAKDPETALILIDVVLGYGANMDPVQELVPVIRNARRLASRAKRRLIFACSVTGTPQDPQDRTKVQAGLRAAGVRIFASNAAASKFAARVAQYLET
jgi:succinyl-CoA synthetase alpha subunit